MSYTHSFSSYTPSSASRQSTGSSTSMRLPASLLSIFQTVPTVSFVITTTMQSPESAGLTIEIHADPHELTHTHTHAHTHTHTHTHMHAPTDPHVCTRTHTHMHIYSHVITGATHTLPHLCRNFLWTGVQCQVHIKNHRDEHGDC